jgi:hypothetical protein
MLFGAVALYAAIGLTVGVLFVLFGVTRPFPHQVSVTAGARILLLPGSVLLWPFVLRRWLQARRP